MIRQFLTLLALVALITPESSTAATIHTFAGTGKQGYTGDGGPATKAQIDNPFGVVRGPDGDIYFCEYTGHRIRKITADGNIHTVAGMGKSGYTGDGGPARQATMNRPHELRFDRNGDLFTTDMSNHAIRKINMKSGIISTVAGTGKGGHSGDGGPATKARLNKPHSLQFGPDGRLYICDIGNHVIRRVNMKTGIITRFAGTGKAGPTPDKSPINGTPLKGPRTIDFDAHGHLWLATREGNQVFRMDLKKKVIHHIAGTGQKGFTGNGGPAKKAKLSGPKGIAIDRNGNVYLADTESHTVRMVNMKTGNLELIAGTGKPGNGTSSDPLKCAMDRLHGVYIDHDGSLFIGDSQAHKIRVIRW
jgi:streptogramin lyase